MRIIKTRVQILLILFVTLFLYGLEDRSAYAEEIIVSGSIDYHPTDWEHEVTVPKFDPALGELVEVHATVAGSLNGSAQYENLELTH